MMVTGRRLLWLALHALLLSDAVALLASPLRGFPAATARARPAFMMGKKGGKPKGAKSGGGARKGQGQQQKASVAQNRLDESTKQFMFTILGLSKTLPDGSRQLLKDINLCF